MSSGTIYFLDNQNTQCYALTIPAGQHHSSAPMSIGIVGFWYHEVSPIYQFFCHGKYSISLWRFGDSFLLQYDSSFRKVVESQVKRVFRQAFKSNLNGTVNVLTF